MNSVFQRRYEDKIAVVKYLGTVKYFQNMPHGLKYILSEKLHTSFLRPNEVLCKEGDEGTCMYVVFKGKVGVYRGGKCLVEIRSGETVGTSAIQNAEPRNATLKAHKLTFILSLSRHDYQLMMTVREFPSGF